MNKESLSQENNAEHQDKFLTNKGKNTFSYDETKTTLANIHSQESKQENKTEIHTLEYQIENADSRKSFEYKIQKGDTLLELCNYYYGDSQVAYILIKKYHISPNLQIGEVLKLPQVVDTYFLKENLLNTNGTLKKEPQLQKEKQYKNYDEYINYARKADRLFDGINDNKSKQNEIQFYRFLLQNKELDIVNKNPVLARNMQDSIAYYNRRTKETSDIQIEFSESPILAMLHQFLHSSKKFFTPSYHLVYRFDSYEEIIEFLSKEKSELSNELRQYDESYKTHEWYNYIQTQKEKYKSKFDTYENGQQNLGDAWNISIYRLLEYLETDYQESYFSGKHIDIATLQGIIENIERIKKLFSSEREFDIGGLGESITDLFHAARGSGYLIIRALGDMIKTLNHQVFFDPSGKREGYFEKRTNTNISSNWEYYLTPVGWSAIANMGISVGIDMLVDLGVGMSALTLKPEDFIKDMKRVPIILKELQRIGIKKLWEQYNNFYAEHPKDGFLSTFYYFVYLTSVWEVAKNIPHIPNIFSFSAKWMGKGTGAITSKVLMEEKRRELKEVSKRLDDVSNELQKLEKQKKELKTVKNDLKSNIAKLREMKKEHSIYRKKKQEVKSSNTHKKIELKKTYGQKSQMEEKIEKLTEKINKDKEMYLRHRSFIDLKAWDVLKNEQTRLEEEIHKIGSIYIRKLENFITATESKMRDTKDAIYKGNEAVQGNETFE